MTNPSEVVVSDAEVMAVFRAMNTTFPWEMVPVMRQALAAFLAKRVPDASKNGAHVYGDNDPEGIGFNACRERVLQGEP